MNLFTNLASVVKFAVLIITKVLIIGRHRSMIIIIPAVNDFTTTNRNVHMIDKDIPEQIIKYKLKNFDIKCRYIYFFSRFQA